MKNLILASIVCFSSLYAQVTLELPNSIEPTIPDIWKEKEPAKPGEKVAPQHAIKVVGQNVMSRLPPKPLEERVRGAETIFVGKVINKVVTGDWARAELEVLTPLKNVKKGAKVSVIWRVEISGRQLFDIAEGAKFMALLKGKHEGRYWLHGEKFKNEKQLNQVKSFIDEEKTPDPIPEKKPVEPKGEKIC